MEKKSIYKCNICGNIIEVLHSSNAPISCCGKTMNKQVENTIEASLEKHIPVIEKQGNGYLIKVGSIEHPMTQEHYIEWIELITENRTYREFLTPNQKPEVFFDNIETEDFVVREYCNLHGLWKNK